jgi:2'-5' RNA ligase
MKMKDYTFLLIPDNKTVNIVNEFRIKYNITLVDGLPPHLTLKKRFQFDENKESALIAFLENIQLTEIQCRPREIRRLGDAVVVIVEGKDILEYHRRVIKALKENVRIGLKDTHEYEGKNFIPHIT